MVIAIAMQIPPGKEWEAFAYREPSLLKPDHKPRNPATVPFPFSDHKLVKPVLEATLGRKSTMLKRRISSYYVLTAAGFLLEYKDSDPIMHPDPTLSLKLSDCELGNPPSRSGKAGFTVRGKDAGKSFGGRTHEYTFRADNMEQATQWWNKIEQFVGGAPVAVGNISDSEGEEASAVSTSSKQHSPPSSAAAPGPSATVHATPQTIAMTGQPITTAHPEGTDPVKSPSSADRVSPPASPTAIHPSALPPTATTTAPPVRSPAQSAAIAATTPKAQSGDS